MDKTRPPYLSDEHLQALGFDGLTDEQRSYLLAMLRDDLEMRVGTRLAAGLTDDQLEQFGDVQERGDDAEALRLLERWRPDYRDVVELTLREVSADLEARRADIYRRFGVAMPSGNGEAA
ncbi:MAG: DUF5663 domain-containing protein [Patulibacter sp.]